MRCLLGGRTGFARGGGRRGAGPCCARIGELRRDGGGTAAGRSRCIAGVRDVTSLRRANDLTIRIEGFGSLSEAGHVEFGANLHAGAALADDIGEEFFDPGAVAVLGADGPLFGLTGDDGVLGVTYARRQQVAGVIDDLNPVWGRACDGMGPRNK